MARGKVAPSFTDSTSSNNLTSTKTKTWFHKFQNAKKTLNVWRLKVINQSINSETNSFLLWSFLIATVSLYNMWSIPLRWAFQLDNSKPWIYTNKKFWIPLDYICDLLLILDIFYVVPKIEIVKEGSVVTNAKDLRKKVLLSSPFFPI